MQTGQHNSRTATEALFLDAAERLLIEIGYAKITTRNLAEEANANQGLIHYYFGSMEELFLRVLERFTERLIMRQRVMYAAEDSFPNKWRGAIQYLDEDRPYQKIWWELQAMSWNRPDYKPRIARVRAEWRGAMRDAIASALSRYALETSDFPLEAWITLILTVNEGIILERLSGVDEGHDVMLQSIQRWLDGMEQKAQRQKPDHRSKKAPR